MFTVTRREVGLLVLTILVLTPIFEALQRDWPAVMLWALFIAVSIYYHQMPQEG